MFFEEGANVFRGACPGHVLSEQPGARKFFFRDKRLLGLLFGSGGMCGSEVKGLFGCDKG